MWSIIVSLLTGQLRRLLGYFVQFLRERRANDPRLLDFALRICTDLENSPLDGDGKYREAFGEITNYATTLGLEIGAAGVDSIIALVLPTVKAQVKA